jgi:hypothetical protein
MGIYAGLDFALERAGVIYQKTDDLLFGAVG